MMARKSTDAYRFGDLLALARQSWITQMATALGAKGYPDYRRSDAAAVRHLRRGPMSLGRLGAALGVTRQAARKVADGLVLRGYATTARDEVDTRHVNVALTPSGVAYARTLTQVIAHLNRDLMRRVDPSDLVAADAVLRALLADEHTKRVGQLLGRPPAAGAGSAQDVGPGDDDVGT
jgi:DNA-binding MarR family transcriptional regulator